MSGASSGAEQVVRHHHRIEAAPCERCRAGPLQVRLHDLDQGIAREVGKARRVDVDGRHPEPPAAQIARVPAAAAGEVEHTSAGGEQPGMAGDPGGGDA